MSTICTIIDFWPQHLKKNTGFARVGCTLEGPKTIPKVVQCPNVLPCTTFWKRLSGKLYEILCSKWDLSCCCMFRTLYTTNIGSARAERSQTTSLHSVCRPLRSLHSLHGTFRKGTATLRLLGNGRWVLRNCGSSTVLLSALTHFALKGSLPSLRILSYFWQTWHTIIFSRWFELICFVVIEEVKTNT